MVEDFLLTKLQVGIPVEYEKQLEQLLQLVTTYASPWTFLPIVLAKRCS